LLNSTFASVTVRLIKVASLMALLILNQVNKEISFSGFRFLGILGKIEK